MDLVRGRMKVMDAVWFAELSPGTRWRFFLDLTIDLLRDEPEEQAKIFRTDAFQSLPLGDQGDLLRLTAADCLRRRKQTAYAIECLEQSLALQPGSRKSQLLLALAHRSPALAAAVLGAWRATQEAARPLRSLRQHQPKPVPAGLVPRSE
jgi:hypothetical protein